MSETLSFSEFFIELFKYIVSLIHCRGSGPVLQWYPLNRDDISFINEILSESDGLNTNESQESSRLNQLIITVNNTEQPFDDNSSDRDSIHTKEEVKVETTEDNEIGSQNQQNSELIVNNKNPFDEYYSLVKGLTFNLVILCFFDLIHSIVFVFRTRKAEQLNQNWFIFLYSCLMIIASALTLEESYYCLIGRGRVRHLNIWVKFYTIIVFIDFSLLFRLIFVDIPHKTFGFLKFLLLICYSFRLLHSILLTTIGRRLERNTFQFKSKFINYIINNDNK